ncbi:hypothetical protein BGZ60DRAFT_528090 [Tricladium varicosporioides]|nr:hypothetical protein BGZ60DRAFT_528090 [Hymenoscyphus varicosporioides]
MAPIRRYLRITKYSVLECRIYVENPVLAESWLLNPRDPVLPRVIESVRPLVLPKLREENERSRAKGSKKKGVKDVIVEEDFEVSIFLTDTSTHHSLLTKNKHFRDKNSKGIQSNSTKLTGSTNDTAIDVDDVPPPIRVEDSDEEGVNLEDLPEADGNDSLFVEEGPRRSKRSRNITNIDSSPESSPDSQPSAKRKKDGDQPAEDKKKMAMDTTYDGFSIYGRVLCLVIKRKDKKGKSPAMLGGRAIMEEWVASTQMPLADYDG